MKTVSVIGLGYVGLPTAILLAEAGWNVLGYDIDETKLERLKQGIASIEEREIAPRLKNVIANTSLQVFSAVQPASHFIIAVPTPCTPEKKIDLSCVIDAARAVGRVLKKNDVVIIESTISIGSTKEVASILENESHLKAGTDFYLSYCPERVLPGNAFNELVSNSRIIGGITSESGEKAHALYITFVHGELFVCNDTMAEMVKLVENSSRDVALAFSNQVAAMARACNIDPFQVIELANKHPRVSLLTPGCGVGGHCLPIDPWFLIETFPHQSTLLHEARVINDRRPYEVYQELKEAIVDAHRQKKKPRVLLLGLTYKPDSDDVRSSPALEVALLSKSFIHECELRVLEPMFPNHLIMKYGLTSKGEHEDLSDFDIVVSLVAHSYFASFSRSSFKEKAVIIDTCGLLYERSSRRFHGAQSALDHEERETSLRGIQKIVPSKRSYT